jgi:hypothetical protein
MFDDARLGWYEEPGTVLLRNYGAAYRPPEPEPEPEPEEEGEE